MSELRLVFAPNRVVAVARVSDSDAGSKSLVIADFAS